MPGGAFESDSRLQKKATNSGTKLPFYAGQIMTNPEYEKAENRDETGFSERKLDINVETGVFRRKKIKKTLFVKKRQKK